MVDEEELLLLLEQRGNYLRDVQKMTDELAEAQSRHDQVSVNLVLEMRQDVIDKCSSNWTSILEMGETGEEDGREIHRLVRSDPENETPRNATEKKIFEVRKKNLDMISRIRKQEEWINKSAKNARSLNEG